MEALFLVAGNGIQCFSRDYGVEVSHSYFYFKNIELRPALCQAPGLPTSFSGHCKHLAVLQITNPLYLLPWRIHGSEGLSA